MQTVSASQGAWQHDIFLKLDTVKRYTCGHFLGHLENWYHGKTSQLGAFHATTPHIFGILLTHLAHYNQVFLCNNNTMTVNGKWMTVAQSAALSSINAYKYFCYSMSLARYVVKRSYPVFLQLLLCFICKSIIYAPYALLL